MKGKSGFTLLELMIVIVIIAVTVAFGLPRYIGVIEKSRAEQALGIFRIVKGDFELQRAAYGVYNASNLSPSVGDYGSNSLTNATSGGVNLWNYSLSSTASTYNINARRLNNIDSYILYNWDGTNPNWYGTHPGKP